MGKEGTYTGWEKGLVDLKWVEVDEVQENAEQYSQQNEMNFMLANNKATRVALNDVKGKI